MNEYKIWKKCFSGQMPDTVIGRVYVTDLDDWDVSDKTFVWKGTPPPHFTLTNDGLILLKERTPEGSYTLTVRK